MVQAVSSQTKTYDLETYDAEERQPVINLGKETTATDNEKDALIDSPLVHARTPLDPFLWPKTTYDIVKQQWTGVVESVGQDEYSVRLKEVLNSKGVVKDGPEEIAILDLDDLPDDEKQLLEVGAQLVWTIGRKGGESEVFSKVVFRRLPRWSSESILEAEAWGKDAFKKLYDSNNSATF